MKTEEALQKIVRDFGLPKEHGVWMVITPEQVAAVKCAEEILRAVFKSDADSGPDARVLGREIIAICTLLKLRGQLR